MGKPIFFAEYRLTQVEARVDELLARAVGAQGPQGDVGPPPKHEWKATALRFELPGNQWGPWVDLQGPPGYGGSGGPGAQGPQGYQGAAGSGTGGTGNVSQALAYAWFSAAGCC